MNKTPSNDKTKNNFTFNYFNLAFSKNLEARKFFLMKIIGVSTLLLSLIYNSYDNYMLTEEETYCINDKTVNLTKPINNFLKSNPFLKNIIIIYSSLLLDIILICILYSFIFHAKNYRLFLTFLLFYFVKAVLHGLFVMQAPNDIIWEYPGFYSLTFSHFSSSDFFYSGQIGMSTMAFLEFKKRNIKFLKYMSLNCLLTQVIVTLVLRTNYIIDIVGGFVFAHYFFIICDYLMPEKNSEEKNNKEDEAKIDENMNMEDILEKSSNGSSCGSRCSCKANEIS